MFVNKSAHHKILLTILLLLFVGTAHVFSQPNLYRFRHLSIEDGLSQNTVNAIVQDKYGFIWMGTANGLNRYDGYRMEEFLFSQTDTFSLSHNQVDVMLEDSKGRLWIGTGGGGLNVYNHDQQKFKRYQLSQADSGSISSNYINAIFEDARGNIWIGTRSGLNKYMEDTDSFKHFKQQSNCSSCLSNNLITSIHSANKDYIWIATLGGGLNKFNTQNETFQAFTVSQKNTLNDNNVWSVFEDTLGKVWIGTEKGALNVYNAPLNAWEYYGYDTSTPNRLGANLVRSLVAGLNGDIWMGSRGGGIYQLNHGERRYFRVYKYNIAQPNGLASNSISSLYKDNSDMLWIGLYDGGVDRINLKQKPFNNLTHLPNDFSSPSNSKINAIFQDSDSLYWIATNEGLNMGNAELNHFQYFFEAFNNTNTINSNTPMTIMEARNGEIWIGTFIGGINIYNKKTKKFRYLTHKDNDENSLPSNFVRSIYEDTDGDFWIGTIRGGLSKYNPNKKEFTHYSFMQNDKVKSDDNFVRQVIGDKQSNIYIASYGGGLIILNKKSGDYKTIKLEINGKCNLSSNQVTTLLFDSDSVLWVGTTYGLNRYDIGNDSIQCFYKKDGLPDNNIKSILEDSNNDLWISTNHGLSVYNKELNKFKNYYREDGLQSEEFNYNSALLDKQGRLLFGSINGLLHFNPDEIIDEEKPLKVSFTELFINNREVNIGDKYNNNIILSKPIYSTQNLNLTYKENTFTLNISAMEYGSLMKVKFYYKLDDVNENYVELGSRNFISFHNLNPGIHKLYVAASLSEWNEHCETTLLTINIEPPLWGKMGFKIGLGLFLGLMVLLIYYLRIHSIKVQKRELERIVYEKTNDLQEVNTMLEENQADLEMQHEELMSQRDLTEEQNEKIQLQNKELMEHRVNLEKLIRERTEELYKAKLRAENADALKTSFLANMSHEIRTPMNAILGFLEILDDPIYTEEERVHFKSLINSSGQSLLTLINDIIDIAKIESGQVDIQKTTFDIDLVFKEINLIYSKKIKDTHADLELILESSGTLHLISDNLRIRQVLINLLDNAIKFTHKGILKFGFSIEQEKIICYVKDTGIGIPEDSQSYIFDRFIKLESGNEKLYGGTGLGLAISKNIVELLGGEIWVESEPGVGSNFYFTLPINK